MADAKILETTITQDADGVIVQLQISDAPPLAEDAAIRLVLTVRVPEYRTPLLAHLERAAMTEARNVLSALLQSKAQEIQDKPHNDLSPTPMR
jgi:hypothetical protein